MNEVKQPKKPLAYYYGIVLLLLLVFNWLVMPMIANAKIKEVDYGTFMSMTEETSAGWRSRTTRSSLPTRTIPKSSKPA